GQGFPTDSRAANDNSNFHIKKYLNDEVLERVMKLDHIAQELGVKLSQLAIAWVLRQPGISSAIVGASRPSQIEENVRATDIKLTDDVLSEIKIVLKEINQFVPNAEQLVDKA